jgi:hypothetical protein
VTAHALAPVIPSSAAPGWPIARQLRRGLHRRWIPETSQFRGYTAMPEHNLHRAAHEPGPPRLSTAADGKLHAEVQTGGNCDVCISCFDTVAVVAITGYPRQPVP